MKGLRIISLLGKTILVFSSAFGAVWLAREMRHRKRLREARRRWNAVGKDVVVLHQLPRPNTCLSLSPFPIKLEAFFRIAGIDYVNDFDFPKHEKTLKSPWITINGEDFYDSHLIVETLSRRFNKDLSSDLSTEQRCVSRALRITMEEHLYWVIVIDRYVYEQGKHLHGFFPSSPPLPFEVYRRRAVKKLTAQAHGQGLLRLGRGAVQKAGIEDFEALSTFLGTKKYLMGGDRPTEVDCVLFGFVMCVLKTSQEGSLYKALVEKRLKNLVRHADRIRSKYFPDWDAIINAKCAGNFKTAT